MEMHPGLYEKILAAGHKPGNHSYSHIKGWGVRPGEYVEDVDFANQTMRSDLFRPPYGRISRRQAQVLGQRYRLVMGGIVSQDYSSLVSPQRCLENVIRHVRPGSIIVFHDSVKSYGNIRYALPLSLEYIKNMGLEFRTLEFKDKNG